MIYFDFSSCDLSIFAPRDLSFASFMLRDGENIFNLKMIARNFNKILYMSDMFRCT